MRARQFEGLLTREFAAPQGGIRRILVIKLDHFGDFIIGLPACERLRESFPDSHITLICGSWNSELAEATGLFDAIRSFDHFPRNARNWNGVPVEPAERFDAVAAGRYDLAIDLRVDTDTRFLLQRVDAARRAGIGEPQRFAYLDIALPVGHQPSSDLLAVPVEVMALGPDDFVARGQRGDTAELVFDFSTTNTCLLHSKPVSLPLARCRAVFLVGLSGLGFSRLGASITFDVLQNGQLIAEQVFTGAALGVLAGGRVAFDFSSNVEGSRFEFRVHAARRPVYGRFRFRSLRIEALESLMRPRLQASELHIGEKLSLLVSLTHDRLRDLYAHHLTRHCPTALPEAVLADLAGAAAGSGLIVVAPLSNSSTRDWPLASYAQLIGQLLDLSDCRIVLVGTAEQAGQLDILRAADAVGRRVVSLAGRTSWATLPALLQRADLVICNNSGIAHLAASCGVRTLAIYSASHQPKEWGPRGRHVRVIMSDVPCSPCGYEEVECCPFGHTCMRRITPDFVCGQALEMLTDMALPELVEADTDTR